MKCLKKEIKGEFAYLLPLSDLHIGDVNFDSKKLQGYLDWVKEQPNAFVFLNGDILNVATISSKSSTFDQEMDLAGQINKAMFYLEPIKDKILGAITGNHESRLESYCGYNPMIPLCMQLGIKYCGYSAILDIKIQSDKWVRKSSKMGEAQSYIFYCHHTTGGGGTVGGKINRVDKLRQLVINADCYVGSHNHQLGVVPVESRAYNHRKGKVESKRQLLVDTGSFLKWDGGYPEMKQMQPSKLGAVRIRMDGTKKDLHCDL